MRGHFYKHPPEAPVTQILQLQASVWQRSLKLARKLKTTQKILPWRALKIRENGKVTLAKRPGSTGQAAVVIRTSRGMDGEEPGDQEHSANLPHVGIIHT